ncbi:hypothetical protein MIMGU_mgv1a026222mg [Erythranthe guttata]|uniref:DNA polymerase delta catalytic subunit n=1 Tax=Erythranthe guttata TaxID=4155 RepID=A0A022Q1K7_ERYGU|nr:hypothetical protein MIMGU_mgv1a026222mg [Erythranthe guttata]
MRKRPAPPTEEEEFYDRRVILDWRANWKRPDLSGSCLSQSQNIGHCNLLYNMHAEVTGFDSLEIDYVVGDGRNEFLQSFSGLAAIIRIFGVTKEGHSVCCLVHGFEPYFYANCPLGMGPDDITRVHQILEGKMKETNNNYKAPKCIRRIELVQKRSIMHYQQETSHPFLKIVVALPTMVASCRGILDRGIQIDGLGMKSFMTYESNINFSLCFMIDCNIVGGNWIKVPRGKYNKISRSLSNCQLEFYCLFSDLISHAPEGEFSTMAPFRILSFDIEYAGRKV